MDSLIINHFAVFAAAIANMVVGAIWYSPALFGKAWQRETGLSDEQLKNINPAKTFGLAFLAAVFIAYNLAAFLGDAQTTASWGATAGFLAGFGFSAMVFWAIGIMEQRSWSYLFVNGGYITVVFTVMGFIIGVWR